MPPTTLEELIFHPAFMAVFVTMLITIGNIIVGVSILPRDQRQRGYTLHRQVHLAVVLGFAVYLWLNQDLRGNGIFDYAVFGYLLVVIPLSRRVNVTLHAIISSLGLVLIATVATLIMF